MESVSENDELIKKIGTMTKDELIVQAKEPGIELTEADFDKLTCEINDDELDAVAGGSDCGCIMGGGAKDSNDVTCACVLVGGGQKESNAKLHCFCIGSGAGIDS